MIDVNLLRRVRTLLFDLDMGKYIDADHLRAEIEKVYKSEIWPWLSGVSVTSAIYDYVLPLIDSLQQDQPEVDLAEEIASFFSKNPIPYEHITDWPLLKNTALHFFNLGLNARK